MWFSRWNLGTKRTQIRKPRDIRASSCIKKISKRESGSGGHYSAPAGVRHKGFNVVVELRSVWKERESAWRTSHWMLQQKESPDGKRQLGLSIVQWSTPSSSQAEGKFLTLTGLVCSSRLWLATYTAHYPFLMHMSEDKCMQIPLRVAT